MFQYKITCNRVSVWGRILYASTLRSARLMAKFYDGTIESIKTKEVCNGRDLQILQSGHDGSKGLR